MEAQTLNCPNCGAAISSDAPRCQYCESKLATIACPSCFGMMFIGGRHCPHCGTAAAETTAAQLSVLKCPRCRIDMTSLTIGSSAMRECEKCAGLWVEPAALEKICADREQQSAVLGAASVAPDHEITFIKKIRYAPCPHCGKSHEITLGREKSGYSPCPQCGQLMNRINFAHCSGVIVDVCKGHGTWFDRDELRQIVEFIRSGGLEVLRQREKMEIEFQRQQLRDERRYPR